MAKIHHDDWVLGETVDGFHQPLLGKETVQTSVKSKTNTVQYEDIPC